jgi:hypothetical protein
MRAREALHCAPDDLEDLSAQAVKHSHSYRTEDRAYDRPSDHLSLPLFSPKRGKGRQRGQRLHITQRRNDSGTRLLRDQTLP